MSKNQIIKEIQDLLAPSFSTLKAKITKTIYDPNSYQDLCIYYFFDEFQINGSVIKGRVVHHYNSINNELENSHIDHLKHKYEWQYEQLIKNINLTVFDNWISFDLEDKSITIEISDYKTHDDRNLFLCYLLPKLNNSSIPMRCSSDIFYTIYYIKGIVIEKSEITQFQTWCDRKVSNLDGIHYVKNECKPHRIYISSDGLAHIEYAATKEISNWEYFKASCYELVPYYNYKIIESSNNKTIPNYNIISELLETIITESKRIYEHLKCNNCIIDFLDSDFKFFIDNLENIIKESNYENRN